MQYKRITEDDKHKLREMIEAESSKRTSGRQKNVDEQLGVALFAFICCITPLAPLFLIFLPGIRFIGFIVLIWKERHDCCAISAACAGCCCFTDRLLFYWCK